MSRQKVGFPCTAILPPSSKPCNSSFRSLPITLICFPWLLLYFSSLVQTHPHGVSDAGQWLFQIFVSISKVPELPSLSIAFVVFCASRRITVVRAVLRLQARIIFLAENSSRSLAPRTTVVSIGARNDCENFKQLRRGERALEIFSARARLSVNGILV